MKLLTTLGACSQFVKAGAVSRTIKQVNYESDGERRIKEIIVHAGQHYDKNMSDIFFEELDLPKSDYFLGANLFGAIAGSKLQIKKL